MIYILYSNVSGNKQFHGYTTDESLSRVLINRLDCFCETLPELKYENLRPLEDERVAWKASFCSDWYDNGDYANFIREGILLPQRCSESDYDYFATSESTLIDGVYIKQSSVRPPYDTKTWPYFHLFVCFLTETKAQALEICQKLERDIIGDRQQFIDTVLEGRNK